MILITAVLLKEAMFKVLMVHVVNKRIRAPFAPVQKKRTVSRGKRNKRPRSFSEGAFPDPDLEEELMQKFDELFGTCEED